MTRLDQFSKGLRVAVIGATGGIGAACVSRLGEDERVDEIFTFSRASGLDLQDEASIAAAAQHLQGGKLDLVLVATGLLHRPDGLQPEKRFADLSAEQLSDTFAVNTIGPALVAKHFLPLLARDQRSVFAALSARVGSISDNQLGGWYGYRASKAALNMMIRTLSIEQRRRNPAAIVVGLHPGTVETGLSQPFQKNVPDGKLFTPQQSAAALLDVINRVAPKDSGHQIAWDGQRIPA